jgi:drug/metabolite transporter (DMT)-like permease
LFALAGFALLSVGDAVVKSITGEWPPTAIAALRYGIGAAGLSVLLLISEGRAAFRVIHPRRQFVRGVSVAVATVSFFGSLFFMPLAEATSIVFVSPIVTAVLAPLILGERSRWRTWLATAVAFVGVLVILRPNLAAVGWPALLPLASAFAMSALFMANRSVAGAASALAMQAMLALIAAPILVVVAITGHVSGIAALAISPPSLEVLAKCAFVALSASSAHWLIYLGTTRAGAASIAPMTYVQLPVAIALGWMWFGDGPDPAALAGAAIIVGAGLFLWRWER